MGSVRRRWAWTPVDSGNVKIGGTGVGDVGRMVIEHVTLASPIRSATATITGEFWFRCK